MCGLEVSGALEFRVCGRHICKTDTHDQCCYRNLCQCHLYPFTLVSIHSVHGVKSSLIFQHEANNVFDPSTTHCKIKYQRNMNYGRIPFSCVIICSLLF